MRLFQRVHDTVPEEDSYYQQRPDATGKLEISSLLKVTASLRVLAYVSSADSLDEHLEMGESTILQSTQHFTNCIIDIFGNEYLMYPNEEDLRRLLLTHTNEASQACLDQLIACTGDGRTTLQDLLGNAREKVKSRYWF